MIRRGLLNVVLTVIVSLVLVGGSVSADLFQISAAVPELSPEIIISSLNNKDYYPSVAYNSKHNEYLVVWHTTWVMGTRDIRGARISEKGQIMDEFVVFEDSTKDSAQPDVAYDPVNDRYLVVFAFDINGDGSNWDVYGRFIPWDGPSNSYPAFKISPDEMIFFTHQWNPKVTYGGAQEEFLVGWWNEDPAHVEKASLFLQRVTASNGTLWYGFSVWDPLENKVGVDIAYNLARNEYLVVFDNGLDIKAIRYTGDLSHDFGGEFPVINSSAAETNPAVAACHDSDQYLVTFQSDQSDQGPANDAIYGRFVSGAGLPGSVHEIADTTGMEQEADVACNHAGTQFIVTWQEEYTNGHFGIWSRLVKPDGTLEDKFPIIVPSDDLDRTNATVAGGQFTYLVVWEHERETFQDIHGKLIGIEFEEQPPPPPTNLTASDGTFSDKVQVSWNPPSGVVNMLVLFRNTSNTHTGETVIEASWMASPYDDTSAVPGTTYYYWIKACKDVYIYYYCSDYSNVDSGWRAEAPSGLSEVYLPLMVR